MTHIEPTFNIPASVGERIIHARRLLVLIHAAAAIDPEAVPIDEEDLRDAISAAADEANIALFPLKYAPFEVASWTPEEPGQPTPKRAASKKGGAR